MSIDPETRLAAARVLEAAALDLVWYARHMAGDPPNPEGAVNAARIEAEYPVEVLRAARTRRGHDRNLARLRRARIALGWDAADPSLEDS